MTTTEKNRDYDPPAAEHIGTTAEKLVALALATGRKVTAEFNGVILVADIGMSRGDIVAAFDTEMNRLSAEAEARRKAFDATPDGQAKLRAAEERARIVRAELALDPRPFEIADQAFWDETVRKNDDGYGSGVVRYAARWAHYMERELAKGATVAAVAKRTSADADLEGVTGFMYGCAVSILAKVWRHGDELRRWHNLDTQIGNEGERANESGGTLNPALLTIGDGS